MKKSTEMNIYEMKREREIEILMMDGCTRSEAEKHLKRGTTVFNDFEENFDLYMEEWRSGFANGSEDYNEMVEDMRRMVKTGTPARDWGVVKDNGQTYYIEYAL